MDFSVYSFETGQYNTAHAVCSDITVLSGILSSIQQRSTYGAWCGENFYWRSFSCNSNPVICVNCPLNCGRVCPGQAFAVNPCGACSKKVAAGSILNVKYTEGVSYPLFLTTNVSRISRNGIDVSFNMSKAGTAYCTAFEANSTYSILSISDLSTNAYSSISTEGGVLTVQLKNLNPDTFYRIYCYSGDFSSHSMPLSVAMAAAMLVSTECCRSLYYSKAPGRIYEYDINSGRDESIFEIALDSQPTGPVTISLSAYTVSCNSPYSAVSSLSPQLYPSVFYFDASSVSLFGQFVLRTSSSCTKVVSKSSGTNFYINVTTIVTIKRLKLNLQHLFNINIIFE